jgi:hypothetical protein
LSGFAIVALFLHLQRLLVLGKWHKIDNGDSKSEGVRAEKSLMSKLPDQHSCALAVHKYDPHMLISAERPIQPSTLEATPPRRNGIRKDSSRNSIVTKSTGKLQFHERFERLADIALVLGENALRLWPWDLKLGNLSTRVRHESPDEKEERTMRSMSSFLRTTSLSLMAFAAEAEVKSK